VLALGVLGVAADVDVNGGERTVDLEEGCEARGVHVWEVPWTAPAKRGVP
jgi:hypothetical protein